MPTKTWDFRFWNFPNQLGTHQIHVSFGNPVISYRYVFPKHSIELGVYKMAGDTFTLYIYTLFTLYIYIIYLHYIYTLYIH